MVRGGDVPYTPLPLSFAILHADGAVEWFVDERKLTPALTPISANGVAVAPPAGLGPGARCPDQ